MWEIFFLFHRCSSFSQRVQFTLTWTFPLRFDLVIRLSKHFGIDWVVIYHLSSQAVSFRLSK